MKKFLIITYIDDNGERKVLERDITLEKIASIGSPANSREYLQFCNFIAQMGTTDVDNTNDQQLTIITGASIRKVQVVFREMKKA